MCLICERIALIKEGANPYLVRELETGYVVIGDHQHFRGYTLFLCKEHVTELHLLEKGFRDTFLREMALVAEAMCSAFKPEKLNYELLGMGDAHVHWHLFPRVAGDTPERGPVWWLPWEEMFAESARPTSEELGGMKRSLAGELDRLLAAEKKRKTIEDIFSDYAGDYQPEEMEIGS